jgi:SAM-dependent methyltransferase
MAVTIAADRSDRVVPVRTGPQHLLAYAAGVAKGAWRARLRSTLRGVDIVAMTAEPVHVPAHAPEQVPASDRAALGSMGPVRSPVHEEVVAVASGLAPGKALDLGCGSGEDAVWLAQQGWIVTAVDASASAIAEARQLAAACGVESTIVFRVADLADWRPISRYDLVFSTFALPARGMGRSRMLETAAAAVAAGGTILLTELDVSLRREGVPEKYLVSLEELERHLDGFRVERSSVRMARHRHGYEERRMPTATVIATRRTDLRTL